MQMYNRLLAAFEQLSNEGEYTNVLKQGWKLYQNEVVQKLNVYSSSMINGIVKDMELHAVVLDSEHIRYSTCTCGQLVYCEHMAALLFQYCKQLENGKVLAEQAYFQLLGLVKASTVAAHNQNESNATGINRHSDPEQIIHSITQQFGDDWKKCKHSFHPLSNTLTAIKGLAKSSEPMIQRLHWCVAILYVLALGEKAIQATDTFSRYYHEMTFKRIAEPWSTQLYELLEELQQKALSEQELQWLNAIMSFTFDRAIQYEKPMFDWDYTYYRLISFIKQEEQNEQLYEKLEKLAVNEERPYANSFLNGSIAALKIGKQADEEAVTYIEKCQFERVQRLIYPVVEARMNDGQWSKVRMWMDYLYQHFMESQQIRSIGPYMQLCRKGSQQQPNEQKWITYMAQFLPHSYHALSEHYLSQKQFQEWAELQIYMGRKPEDFKAHELQVIEKQAPFALLPMYHQAIDLAVHGRNRQGYRLAAKYMKKLQGLYEQLEKPHIWKRYFDLMQHRYSRLRAFQEELLKGKLL